MTEKAWSIVNAYVVVCLDVMGGQVRTQPRYIADLYAEVLTALRRLLIAGQDMQFIVADLEPDQIEMNQAMRHR